MINRRRITFTMTILFLFVFTTQVSAISFDRKTDSNGNVSTSNLPSFCVSAGILVCHRNSALFKGGAMSFSLQPRDKSGQGNQRNSRPVY